MKWGDWMVDAFPSECGCGLCMGALCAEMSGIMIVCYDVVSHSGVR